MRELHAIEITWSAQEKHSKKWQGLTQTSLSPDSSSQPSCPGAFGIATYATFKEVYTFQDGDDSTIEF